MNRCNTLIGIVLLISLFSCHEKREDRQVERSFYYWKTVLNITAFEKQKLDSLKVKNLYIKFFDVDWDDESRKAKPVAKLQTANYKLPIYIKVIPTVFITNSCIQKIDSAAIKQLALDITGLIKNDVELSAIPNLIEEIQIDCDWTVSTREKYFSFLREIKRLNNVKLSATIRLHQVKYVTKSGVPPVDRGLLMCYNMGNLKNPATKNSIIETEELKKYIGSLSNYPLALDVAFPLFDWKVLYRNNMFTGLIQNLPEATFNNSFSKKSANRFIILKDTLLNGYDLKKGDLIRDEQADIKELLAAAAIISTHLKNTSPRVSLYHLDSVILSKYNIYELESIYNRLR